MLVRRASNACRLMLLQPPQLEIYFEQPLQYFRDRSMHAFLRLLLRKVRSTVLLLIRYGTQRAL